MNQWSIYKTAVFDAKVFYLKEGKIMFHHGCSLKESANLSLQDHLWDKVIGNKAKEQISQRVLKENKAGQIFRKTNISYLLINVLFSENLTCFFLIHPFWDSPFCLITDKIIKNARKFENEPKTITKQTIFCSNLPHLSKHVSHK